MPKDPCAGFESRSETLAQVVSLRSALLDPDRDVDRADVRALIQCVTNETPSNLQFYYKYFPRVLSLEDDIEKALSFYQNEADYDCAVPHLRFLRRFALRRCALSLAYKIVLQIESQHDRRWLWNRKDFVLPRVPLAMLVGYAGLFGSEIWRWLKDLSGHDGFFLFFNLASCGFAWLLIFINIRERIGAHPEVCCRTWKILGIALLWCVSLTSLAWIASRCNSSMAAQWEWNAAWLVTLAALDVAILVQFFFTDSGSIADPL